MIFFRKIASLVFGPVAQIVGLVGSILPLLEASDRGWLLRQLADPYIYFPSVGLGTLITTFVWGGWWAEHKIKSSGGYSRQEFPLRSLEWDRLDDFPVWQIAWLWKGLEPRMSDGGGVHPNAPAYSTFQVLKQHLNQQRFKGASQVNGTWLETRLSRQQLIDYALEIGDRPVFLFKFDRSRWPFGFGERRIPHAEVTTYEPLSNLRTDWLMASISIENKSRNESEAVFGTIANLARATSGVMRPLSQNHLAIVEAAIREKMVAGKWEMISRRKIGKLLYGYRKISQREVIKNVDVLVQQWSMDERYNDVRLRDVKPGKIRSAISSALARFPRREADNVG